jgi:hypothetical protein
MSDTISSMVAEEFRQEFLAQTETLYSRITVISMEYKHMGTAPHDLYE